MNPKLAIMIPIRDEITPETQYAIDHHMEFDNTPVLRRVGYPVDVARNALLKDVLGLPMALRPECRLDVG
jgi:hypothetical protein